MSTLTPFSFLIPAVALALTIVCYRYFLKHTAHKTLFKKITVAIATIGLLLNFLWEMLQMPLYQNMPFGWQSTLFCALASLADVIMLLLLYYGFAFIYKNPFWITALSFQRILVLIVAGGIGAVLFELRHLSSGSWSYDGAMPLIPVLNVGLSPVLQFMVLPIIILYLTLNINKSGKKV